MKTKLLLFFTILGFITPSIQAKSLEDETKIIILEALENEKTRSATEIPIQAYRKGDLILFIFKENIDNVNIKITSSTGEIIYDNTNNFHEGIHFIDANFLDINSNSIIIRTSQNTYTGIYN